ncbi:MAG: SLBB domain-containing protein [Gammaproteobacteria bacterium]|nr:SLBB domain-containing protein [Gammaproteobacteria bacterium]
MKTKAVDVCLTKVNNLYCKWLFAYIFVLICLLSTAGCYPELSTTQQLQRFDEAGPITPQVDVNRLLNAKMHTGYYRVIPGDILELQMPATLRVVSPDLAAWFSPNAGHDDVEPYRFRVSDAGIISLPIIGKIPVSGMTLTEMEVLVVNSYYPKYVQNLPSVICKVAEYQTQNITIVGGVVRPGLYKLSNDEMSLISALMKSGGIIEDGAALITIQHANPGDKQAEGVNMVSVSSDLMSTDDVSKTITEDIQNNLELLDDNDNSRAASAKSGGEKVDLKPIVLPVKDLNIPFADVVLLDGDIIMVERLNPEVFTVLGPVKTPGVFPYPPDVDYNLMQAIAFAGGFDLTLNPSYITMYRQDADGQIVTATFQLNKKTLNMASGLMIKPGDVISVEMTADVRTRMIVRDMLNIRVGYDLNDMND